MRDNKPNSSWKNPKLGITNQNGAKQTKFIVKNKKKIIRNTHETTKLNSL